MITTALLLSACGGSGTASTPTTEPTTPPPTTIGEAIKSLDASGASPKLDRSTSILGQDADSNGVRDDLDAYIDALPDSAEQKAALKQSSRALRNALLIDLTDTNERTRVSKEIMNSVFCMGDRYPGPEVSDKIDDIEKFTINTKERFLAYDKYNASVNGTSTVAPRENACE